MAKENSNPFKELESQEELPPELKKKVMGSIGLIRLISGVGELFTARMGGTAIKMTQIDKDIPSENGSDNGHIKVTKSKK